MTDQSTNYHSAKKCRLCQRVATRLRSTRQANLEHAALVLALPTDYADSNSDAVVSSMVGVLCRARTGLRVVAECLDDRRRHLFNDDGDDHISVVCGQQVASNILIQELADPGVSLSLEEVTSNMRGSTLFSSEVNGELNGAIPT